MDRAARRIAQVATRLTARFVVHWLALANAATGLYLGLPILAPVLMWHGRERLGKALYVLFSPLCHQLPQRSFWLFGPHTTYARSALSGLVGAIPRTFLGSAQLGYKTAVCQRDLAIFGVAFVGGLAFGLFRRYWGRLSWRGLIALILPMAIDGTGQLLGLWESTWASRVVTGALFGLAMVWSGYPRLDAALRDVSRALPR